MPATSRHGLLHSDGDGFSHHPECEKDTDVDSTVGIRKTTRAHGLEDSETRVSASAVKISKHRHGHKPPPLSLHQAQHEGAGAHHNGSTAQRPDDAPHAAFPVYGSVEVQVGEEEKGGYGRPQLRTGVCVYVCVREGGVGVSMCVCVCVCVCVCH